MDFQHLPSSQNLTPDASLVAADVTTLPGTPAAQYFSSGGVGGLTRDSQELSTLQFDVTNNGFAGISLNFDPNNNNANGADLSGLTKLTFGLNSTKAKKVKIEIDDASGKRAVLYANNIDTTRSYYQFLSALIG